MKLTKQDRKILNRALQDARDQWCRRLLNQMAIVERVEAGAMPSSRGTTYRSRIARLDAAAEKIGLAMRKYGTL